MATVTYESLCTASHAELEELMRERPAPSFEALSGWEFRGFNRMALTELLRIRKFKKGFYADEKDASRLYGYNVKVVQNGRGKPWLPLLRDDQPIRHGLYDVYPVRPGSADEIYPQSLLLDYACGRNGRLDPSSVLRDYLVQASPDHDDLMVGKAYLALGGARVFGGYFLLERYIRVG